MLEFSFRCWLFSIRLAIPETVAIAGIVATWIGGGSLVALWLWERRRT